MAAHLLAMHESELFALPIVQQLGLFGAIRRGVPTCYLRIIAVCNLFGTFQDTFKVVQVQQAHSDTPHSSINHIPLQKRHDRVVERLNRLRLAPAVTFARINVILMGDAARF